MKTFIRKQGVLKMDELSLQLKPPEKLEFLSGSE